MIGCILGSDGILMGVGSLLNISVMDRLMGFYYIDI